MNDLLTPAETAELLRRSVATLATWRHLGTGPAYTRAGGRILYARADIDAWLTNSLVTR